MSLAGRRGHDSLREAADRLRDHPDPQSWPFLCRAIDSVLSQEGIGEQFDIEVLVIDDGFTDETPNVVRRYPGLHYIRRPENHGTSAARNAGLEEAKGRYVGFLDDDIWLPWKRGDRYRSSKRAPRSGSSTVRRSSAPLRMSSFGQVAAKLPPAGSCVRS